MKYIFPRPVGDNTVGLTLKAQQKYIFFINMLKHARHRIRRTPHWCSRDKKRYSLLIRRAQSGSKWHNHGTFSRADVLARCVG